QGDQTYTLPRGNDDYDLVVDGPKGKEYLQIIASRERFPIPDWYRHSGIVNDNENPNDFMDNLNDQYFVRYDGQRFAYDRAVIYVNDWEPDYFHPVYYPVYPSWAVCGNLYVDYPWGGSIYIDGVYWGCAPLYIPRILVGWNTITVFDRDGYCWEHDVQISRYHTVILDRSVVRPGPGVMSKYKQVRTAGYVDPVTHGYPQYKQTISRLSGGMASGAVMGGKLPRGNMVVGGGIGTPNVDLPKKYARGAVKLVETPRGYESTGGAIAPETNADLSRRSVHFRDQAGVAEGAKSGTTSGNNPDGVYRTRRAVRGDNGAPINESAKVEQRKAPQQPSDNSSGYYQRKEGQVERRTPTRVEPQRQAPRQESNQPRQAPRVEQRGGGGGNGGHSGGGAAKPASNGGGGGGRGKR
ncbi:MAG TPA: hypothetical protein VMS71_07490, partial [Candidatus Acidoferrum sp.]|nr:hypothetical protein [Candidatus Acidoferrum sp.]